ncbi:MAG: hypothetical protein WCH11_07595, partial [Bdellovibrio sp.]
LLKQLNNQFMKGLVEEVARHPLLKETLFARIQVQSFTLPGVHRLLKQFPFPSEEYDHSESIDFLIRRNQRKLSPARREAFESFADQELAAFEFFLIRYQPWIAGVDGLPEFESLIGSELSLHHIEGADIFFPLLQGHFEKFFKQSAYGAAFENFKIFMQPLLSNFESSEMAEFELLNDLQRALLWTQRNPHQTSTGTQLRRDLKNFVLRDIFHREQNSSVSQIQSRLHESESKKRVMEALEELASYRREFVRIFQGRLQDYELVEEMQSGESLWNSILLWVLENVYNEAPVSQQLKSRRNRSTHPAILPKSIEQDHGTKVGSVMAESTDLAIFPIQMNLEFIEFAADHRAELEKRLKADFTAWIEHPVVHAAVRSHFGEIFLKDLPKSVEFSPREFSALVYEKLQPFFNRDLASGRVATQLKDLEVLDIVRREKLLFANASFILEYSSPEADVSDQLHRRSLKRIYEFLNFEYYKFRWSERVRQASQTLFVVAAGNSNAWTEGFSRSSVPLNLESPFLEAFVDPSKGWLIPNNRIKNVLIVGGLNPQGQLSSISNIPLNSNSPVIFAQAEDVTLYSLTNSPE